MPQQIDTSLVIKDYQGKDLVKSFHAGEEPSPLTIRRLIQFAMSSPLEGDDRVDYKKKFTWHQIAEKSEQPIVEYSAADTITILERAGKIFTSLVFGRLKEVLDPEPKS